MLALKKTKMPRILVLVELGVTLIFFQQPPSAMETTKASNKGCYNVLGPLIGAWYSLVFAFVLVLWYGANS